MNNYRITNLIVKKICVNLLKYITIVCLCYLQFS